MTAVVSLVRVLLFYYPAMRWVIYFGLALMVSGELISLFTTNFDGLQKFLLQSGFFIATFLPSLVLPVVCRRVLSSKQLSLLPKFRIKALLALTIVASGFFGIYCVANLLWMPSLEAEHLLRYFALSLVLYSLAIWSIFAMCRFRFGLLLLSFGLFFGTQWLSEYYKLFARELMAEPSRSFLLTTIIWSMAWGFCLKVRHIAATAQWQHDSNNEFNQGLPIFFRLPFRVISAERAMLLQGSDSWHSRFFRSIVFFYVFPVIMFFIFHSISNEPIKSFGDEFNKIVSMLLSLLFILMIGLLGASASNLRLMWLRSRLNRQQLISTLLRIVNEETLIFVGAQIPLWCLRWQKDDATLQFDAIFLMMMTAVYWLTANTVVLYVVIRANSWKTGLTSIAGLLLLGITFLLMNAYGETVGVVVAVLAVALSVQTQKRLKHSLCSAVDLHALHPVSAGRELQSM